MYSLYLSFKRGSLKIIADVFLLLSILSRILLFGYPPPPLMVTAFLTNLLGCQRRAVCFRDSFFSNYLFSLLWRLTPHLLLEIVPLSASSRIKYFSEPLLTWSHKRQITNCTTIQLYNYTRKKVDEPTHSETFGLWCGQGALG